MGAMREPRTGFRGYRIPAVIVPVRELPMARPSRPPITEERIRERPYRIWIEEGQPQGKDAEHWEKARELLALESDPEEEKQKVDHGYNRPGPWGEPVEEATILENQGEFPT